MINEIKTLTSKATFFVTDIRRELGSKAKVIMVSFDAACEPFRLTFPVSDEVADLMNVGDRYVLTMIKQDWFNK